MKRKAENQLTKTSDRKKTSERKKTSDRGISILSQMLSERRWDDLLGLCQYVPNWVTQTVFRGASWVLQLDEPKLLRKMFYWGVNFDILFTEPCRKNDCEFGCISCERDLNHRNTVCLRCQDNDYLQKDQDEEEESVLFNPKTSVDWSIMSETAIKVLLNEGMVKTDAFGDCYQETKHKEVMAKHLLKNSEYAWRHLHLFVEDIGTFEKLLEHVELPLSDDTMEAVLWHIPALKLVLAYGVTHEDFYQHLPDVLPDSKQVMKLVQLGFNDWTSCIPDAMSAKGTKLLKTLRLTGMSAEHITKATNKVTNLTPKRRALLMDWGVKLSD